MRQKIACLTGVPIFLRHSIFSFKFSSFSKWKRIAQLALGLYVSLLTVPSYSVYAVPLKVEVVLSEEGGVYREFADFLSSNLLKQDITLSVKILSQPGGDADLKIAVGMKAAAALDTNRSIAILNVYVPREGYIKLQPDFPKRSSSFSAIYLDQPVERQLDLIVATQPHAKNIGVLYFNPPDDLLTLRMRAKDRNLILHEQAVTSDLSLPAALHDILTRSEVILALPDADVYNTSTIRNILMAAYRAQVPIIGFSASFVRAGALCATYSTPAQIAAQAATAVKQFAVSHTLPLPQFPYEFEVLVNRHVAQSLGLNISNSVELKRQIGVFR